MTRIGFFDLESLSEPGIKRASRARAQAKASVALSCESCKLYERCLSPKMEPYGKFRKGIMVIGEAPGAEEDRKGKPWQGTMGQALQRTYAKLGIDLFEDCVSLNAVNCRPSDEDGNNRAPTSHEISCCREVKVLKAIERYSPKLIILHGSAALESVIGHCWKGGPNGIAAWAGYVIPLRQFRAWACPTFHPSFVERGGDTEARALFEGDLRRALQKLEEPFPDWPDEKDCVEVADDPDPVLIKVLKDRPRYLAFDIEATGKKPFDKSRHQIVSIALCYEEDRAYAMPFPRSGRSLRLLKRLLEHEDIGKIGANIKYEDNWLATLVGINVRPWAFDTVLAAHVLDNRHGTSGLKFQAFVNFGTPDYSSELEPYLKTRTKSANDENRILELTKDPISFRRLLVYNGIDALVTYRLAMVQMEQLKERG